MSSDLLAARIEDLPEDSRKVVLALLEVLAKKPTVAPRSEPRHEFKFDWEGALSDSFTGATSVELQHRANSWR